MDYANLHRLNHIGEWSEVMVNNKIHYSYSPTGTQN
jgi:hypothetical protein